MAVEEVETIEQQIRKICPSGAIGYRIQVYEPTPEIYPLKRSGADMYAIDPEGIEYPVGVPPGDHQVIFLDKSSRAIKAYKNPVITIEKPRSKKPSATAETKEETAKDAEDAASADLESEINAAAAGFNFDFSGDYQKQVQDHDMYRKRIRLAKEARYTAEIAEMQANVTASHDEILRKILQINKTQKFHDMAQLSLTQALAEAYAKVPQPAPPPAPPTDWGGLIKTTLDGISGIVQTFGGKRQEVDRAAFAREVAEAVKGVAKGEHVGALPADRVAEKADKRDNNKRDNDDKRDNDKRDNDKRDNDKRDNDKRDNDKRDNDKRDNDKHDNDKRDNDKRGADRGEKAEADKRATADQSSRSVDENEKKKESVNSFSSAWKYMRAAWLGLTDQAIVQMVAQPVLLVAFLATLGSMAPQRPKLDRQATIYLPAVRR